MLRYLNHLFQVQVVLFLIVQLTLLYLQGAALRRHKNCCFLLLVASTICGIFVLAATGTMLVFTRTEALLVWSYSLGFLFGIAQGVLGLIGAALLFRDYRRLAEHVSSVVANQLESDRIV